RIPEVYHWLLVPVQKSPQEAVEWQAFRLASGHDALAVRVSKKLRNDELLLTGFAGTRLKMELDRVPPRRNTPVAVKQLAEDVAESAKVPVEDGSGAQGDGVEGSTTPASGTATSVSSKPPAAPPKRFHGTVTLDATRVGRDAGRVAEEVIAHLTGLVGAKVTV